MVDEALMQSAQLAVVQPGSRTSFRRRTIDALLGLVPAKAGFLFADTEDARAYGEGTRVAFGAARPLTDRATGGEGTQVAAGADDLRSTGGRGRTRKLTEAFGFDLRSVVAAPRRAYFDHELYPADVRAKLPFFAEHSAPDALSHALLLFLHEGGVLFGLAGLERAEGEPPFTEDDLRALERLAPFVLAGARAQLAYDERSREAAALRALGHVRGTLLVVDRDRRSIVWAANRERGLEWATDVDPIQHDVLNAAEELLAARAAQKALPTPPRLPDGVVAAVAKIEGDPVFGGARCAVVRIEPTQNAGAVALEGLSRREREIARLLVAGYSGVNVAAIAGLSENTVRTYVRRLYAKLGVSNRADLVRKLVSPDPSMNAPSSRMQPPPDSSLLAGDDTLD